MKNNNKSVLMQYTGKLVRSQLEGSETPLIPTEISFEELEKIAYSAHMEYMILGALIKLPLSQEQIVRTRMSLKRSTFKTLLQIQNVKMLQEKFEQNGIRNQVLKGAVMKYIYPRPELREMSDIDFMLYEDDFSKAEKLIAELGFHKLQAIKHHVIYEKKPLLILEMHWDLYEKTVDKGQYMYYKKQFRAVLKDGMKYTYEFTKENFYVYMISHMAKHFYENGCGIRNLVDIYVYNQKFQKEMDRSVVAQELKNCGILDFERHVTKLADIWLNDRESTVFYNNLFTYMVDCGIYGKCENGIWGQLCKQEDINIGKSKGRELTYYFPPAGYMEEHYPWIKGKRWLLPAAWLYRGIHGLFNEDSMNRAKILKNKEKYDVMMEIYHELNLNFVK